VVILDVHHGGQGRLLPVAEAARLACFFTGFREYREQNCGENCNNCYYGQEFNQRKCSNRASHCLFPSLAVPVGSLNYAPHDSLTQSVTGSTGLRSSIGRRSTRSISISV